MMDLLHFITFTCAILAVLLLGALVLVRSSNRRRERARAPRRTAASAALLLWSEGDGDDRITGLLQALEPDLVIEVLADVIPVASEAQTAVLFRALRRIDTAGAISRRLKTADEAERIFLSELLAATGGEPACRLLREVLGDRAADVRVAAAIGLAQLSKLPPLGQTLTALGATGRQSARLVQMFEIAMPLEAEAVRNLVSAPDVEPRVRVSAMQALVRLWDPASVMILEKAAASDEQVATAAASEVRWLPPQQGAAMLRRLMESGSTNVRRAAAAEAANFNDPILLAPLERLANDNDPLVRHLAARSARHVGAAPAHISASIVRPTPAIEKARA